MTIDERLRAIRDAIQRDIGNRGLARDPTDNLLTACPDAFAAACRSISDHPAPRIGIVTGFMIPSVDPPTGETDGPLGALFLAATFERLGMSTVVLSDAAGANALRAGIAHLELAARFVDLDSVDEPELHLTHLIAIERSGPSDLDRNHTMRGRDITELTAPAHRLFEGPREYVTIGIGDGGNEIGMGKIPRSTIAKNIPNGELVACRVTTDHLIVAGVSNWGGYALAAGVTLLRGEPFVLDVDAERRLLEHLVKVGPLVDGVRGTRTASVDGMDWAEYIGPIVVIAKLRSI